MRGKFTTYAVIVMLISSLASWGSMARRAVWHGGGYSGGGWATGGGGGHK